MYPHMYMYIHIHTYKYLQSGGVYINIYIFTNINMYIQTRIDMTGELQVCFVVAFFFLSSFYLFLYFFTAVPGCIARFLSI